MPAALAAQADVCPKAPDLPFVPTASVRLAQADHVADLCGPPTVDEHLSRHALGPHLEALVARTDLSLAGFLDGLG